jgi:hypothetical protein
MEWGGIVLMQLDGIGLMGRNSIDGMGSDWWNGIKWTYVAGKQTNRGWIEDITIYLYDGDADGQTYWLISS